MKNLIAKFLASSIVLSIVFSVTLTPAFAWSHPICFEGVVHPVSEFKSDFEFRHFLKKHPGSFEMMDKADEKRCVVPEKPAPIVPSPAPVAVPVIVPAPVTSVAPVVVHESVTSVQSSSSADHRVEVCHLEPTTGNFEVRHVQPDQVQKDLNNGDYLLSNGGVCVNPVVETTVAKNPTESVVVVPAVTSNLVSPSVNEQNNTEVAPFEVVAPAVSEVPSNSTVNEAQPEEVEEVTPEVSTPPNTGDGSSAEEFVP